MTAVPAASPRADESASGRVNRSTLRVLGVLSRFVEADGALGVTEISAALGMTKNMVHRALSALVAEGYLVRDAAGRKYRLGWRVLELRGHDPTEFDIRAVCRPTLEALHALTGESVFLSIIAGRERVNIDDITAVGPRVSHVQRGLPRPLHITVTGRTLLAFLSDTEIAAYLRAAGALEAYPDARIRSAAALHEAVAEIRRAGCAVGPGETLAGVARANYACFPVLDSAGRPHAAITVGGPAERFTLERAHTLLPQMRALAGEAERRARLVPANTGFHVGAR